MTDNSGCLREAADPRVRRTHRLLLDAFAALLKERTIHSMTVGDIAAQATVNRATFYAHFQDKQALVEEYARVQFRELLETRVPCPTTFQAEQLGYLVEAVALFLQGLTTCRRADREYEPLLENAVRGMLQGYLLRWLQASGLDQTAAELQASVLGWAVFGAGAQWSRKELQVPIQSLSEQVQSLLLGGLRLPAVAS